MNELSINEAPVNGIREVPLGGQASLTVDADGALMLGKVIAGDAGIEVASTGSLMLGKVLSGEASLEVIADGDVVRGLRGEGEAGIELSASLDLYRGLRGEASPIIELVADGDLSVVPPVSATFAIQLMAGGELSISRAIQADPSLARIRLEGDLAGRSVTPKMGIGEAVLRFDARGRGRLIMQCTPGEAGVSLAASMESRLGRKVRIEGRPAILALFATGRSVKWRQRHAEGHAVIRLLASEARYGKPTLPDEYAPAPIDRRFEVPGDNRLFIVPPERMLG